MASFRVLHFCVSQAQSSRRFLFVKHHRSALFYEGTSCNVIQIYKVTDIYSLFKTHFEHGNDVVDVHTLFSLKTEEKSPSPLLFHTFSSLWHYSLCFFFVSLEPGLQEDFFLSNIIGLLCSGKAHYAMQYRSIKSQISIVYSRHILSMGR